jgi:two-component system phosphate regulon sensor histidine kinase PhoR
MAIFSGIVVLVIAVSGLLAARGLRERELARIARSLEADARLVRALAQSVPFAAPHRAELDAIADRAQLAAGARVTLIDSQGVVVGDSDVPLAKLSGVENHAERPEVRDALRGSVGTSERRSETVGRPLFYLAIPMEGAAGGVVRLAVDLSDLESAVAGSRRVLVVAGAIGLCAALGFAYALSWLTLRPLREMHRAAASIAGGDLDSRLTLRSIDELGGISTAVNELAEQIRSKVEETTHEKERLQAVMNGMVEGVLVIEAAGRVLLVNDRLRSFYGIAGEVRGRSPLEVVRDAEVESLLQEASTTDEAVSRRIAQVGGQRRTFRVHAVRFPAKGGPRIGTVAVFHDITEVARLEAVRRDFVANASHELRTPVAAIRGFAETLLHGDELSEADRHTYLETIQRHAVRLGNLVADLLSLSRIEGRQAQAEAEPVDVTALAEVLVRESSERFAERGLAVNLSAPEPAVAWARRQDLEQVLSNLIDNAVHYTDAGGRIDVSVTTDGNRVVARVSDTGIGISASDQERVFERFYRVDAARSRAEGGTGLGLSIVKHLVLAMGGEVTLESEPQRGSTFSVSLRAAPHADG